MDLKFLRMYNTIGSEYYGNKIGNCKYSDITVFSFSSS